MNELDKLHKKIAVLETVKRLSQLVWVISTVVWIISTFAK